MQSHAFLLRGAAAKNPSPDTVIGARNVTWHPFGKKIDAFAKVFVGPLL
jgi:hypothetical protein